MEEVSREGWIEGDFEGVYAGEPKPHDLASDARRYTFELQSGTLTNLVAAAAPDAEDGDGEVRQAQLVGVALPPPVRGAPAPERTLYDLRIRDWRLCHPAEIRGRAYGTIVGRLRARIGSLASDPGPKPALAAAPMPDPAAPAPVAAPTPDPVAPALAESEPLLEPSPPQLEPEPRARVGAPAPDGPTHEIVGGLDARRVVAQTRLVVTLLVALLLGAVLVATARSCAEPRDRAAATSQEAGVPDGSGSSGAGENLPAPDGTQAAGRGATLPSTAVPAVAPPPGGSANVPPAGGAGAPPSGSLNVPPAGRPGAPPRTTPAGRWPALPGLSMPDLTGSWTPFGGDDATGAAGPATPTHRAGAPPVTGTPASDPLAAPDSTAPARGADTAREAASAGAAAPAGRQVVVSRAPSPSPPRSRSGAAAPEDVPGGWVAPDEPGGAGEHVLISIEHANRNPDDFFDGGGHRRVYLQTDPVFESGGSRLRARGPFELTRLAALLGSRPEQRVAIEVHTDAGGGPKEQLARAERRAAVVQRFLVERGHVDPSRFQVIPVGGAHPIVPPDGSFGAQASNRRLEIRLIP